MTSFSVEVVRSPDRLAEVRVAWEALAAAATEPNPFYEPWMFLPSLAAEQAGALRCLLVWAREQNGREAKLAALLPLRRAARFKGLPITVLGSWTHPSWPLGTPLLREGMERSCIKAILDWLDADHEGGRALELKLFPADGRFSWHLADALRERNRIAVWESFSRPMLRRLPGAEAYLATALSSASRKALRRKERRLAELGRLERVALGSNDPADPAIEAFLELEASGWKGRIGGALACTPQTLRLARSALSEAHRQGRLQLVGFDLDGRPISRCCNITAGEAAFAYRTAYDEAFARYSPGVLAEVETVRHFHSAPGLAYMDSITDPANPVLGHLWLHRRSLQSVVVGAGAMGELWVSMLPLLRWTKHRITRRRSVLEPVAQDVRPPAYEAPVESENRS